MTAGRLFIVEDDDRIRTALRMALEDEGYEVAEAADAESALLRIPGWQPDLVIVDLMLGAMDGYTCIRELRKSSDVPIIVVSARVDTHDIVAGLEAGADDYVTKPFQIKEITARLRALKRRSDAGRGASTAPDVVLDAGRRLVLSTAAGVVRSGDAEVALTLTEFQILSALAADPGVVLSRSALLGRVWDQSFAGDERLVDAHVRRLRTKIERDPARPELVVTVRGMGYRLDRRLSE